MKLFKKMMGLLLAVAMVISSFGTISAQAVSEDGGNELIKSAYAESWVELDCNPMNLLDGNASTQWHTLYAGMNPESETNHIPEDANGNESINNSNPMAKYNNLYLVLREPTTVENFYFQARWNASKNFVSNGAPHTFNIYVSEKDYEETKDIDWGEPVAKSPTGGFQYKSTKDLVQYVRFPEAQENVKTVRIEVTHSYNQNKSVDNKWIRMEEAGINMVLPEEKEYLPLPKEDPLYTIACVSDIHVDYGLEHSATHIRDTITTVMNRVRQEETPNAIVVLGDTISANMKTTGGWYTGTDAERETVYHQVLDAVYNTLESGMEAPKVMYVAGNHEPEVGMAAFNSQSFIEDGTERTMGEMIAAKSPEDIYANAYFQDNMTGLLTNPEGERNVLAYHYNVDGIDYFGLNPPYVVRASTYAFDWGAMEWVRNKMESIGKDKTFIVLSHYPIGTDLTGGSADNTNAETTARLKEIFAEFPKTIVLCGHIHTQYIEKDTAEGVVAYAADGVTRHLDTYSTPSGFINMFGGSQGYYGTMSGLVPQGALSAKTPNYNQALMVYFYQDRICFQMKNYGSAGGELTPYTIMREVDLDAAADKTLLNSIIGEAEALLKEITEEEMKVQLEAALSEARTVQGAEDATQAQVNAAMTALKKAMDENADGEPEEAASYVDVDDAYETKADELFKIKYLPEGKWTGAANHPEMFINATEHYTAKSTEQFSYEMKFIGTGLEIIATKRDTHANCDVYIDDVYVGDLIAYTSGEKVNQQIVFEIDGLENKEHILKVVKKADDANAMQLDMIRVFYDELKASAITLDAKDVRIGIGGSKQVTANVEPWFVNAEVEWSSADETVATVNEKGLITAVAKDYAQTVITAKAKGTDLSAQVTVTVDPDLSKALVTVRDEKLLDIQKDYAALVEEEQVLSFEGTAWKDDTINSKIMIAAKDTAVHNAEVIASDFTNENGDVLKAENISIKWLKEVEAYNGKGTKRGELLAYPDIIHKGGAADVAAKTVKFAWVAINVPKDAKPGTYTGTISVKADEMKNPVELIYTVKVINLVQPELEAIDLQFWQHPFSVANYYLGLGSNVAIGSYCTETATDFYFTEKHFNLMRAEMEEYASIGGHDLVATIVEEAWNHQSFYGDPSMIKWTKNADGTWTFDYTWYDAWVEFAIECGIIDPATGLGKIKCYSMVPWNNYVSYYDEATKSTVRRSYTPGNQDWRELWTPFLTDFMKHSEEKGWFDITYISMDERTMAQLQPTVDLIESITNEDGEHFLISSCLNYAIATDYTFTDHIDDISVGLKHIQANVANSLSDHRRELGLNTTYYTCTGEYPSNFVISDPGDNYWTMWYTMTMGTDGYLRWAWDNYLYDMHGNISYRSWEPGDCWFFYPLEREEVDMNGDCVAGFYSTPRYEMLKQGIRDVAKAKYLMAQSEEYYKALDEITGSIVRPKSGTVNGSTTYANQTERMLTHSETDRVYAAMSAIAEEYAAALTEEVCEVFPDVEHGTWYEAGVQYVYDKGIMSGSNGLFNPTGNITRAQVVATLYKLEGSPEVTDFKAVDELVDVAAGEWYTNAVCWAYNTGVTTGNQTTKMFNMSNPVTRQQLASFFYNYAEYKGLDVTTRGDYSDMVGADQVADYAADTMKWAVGTGLITGSKTTVNGVEVADLKPTGTATRGQVAAMIQRFCTANDL